MRLLPLWRWLMRWVEERGHQVSCHGSLRLYQSLQHCAKWLWGNLAVLGETIPMRIRTGSTDTAWGAARERSILRRPLATFHMLISDLAARRYRLPSGDLTRNCEVKLSTQPQSTELKVNTLPLKTPSLATAHTDGQGPPKHTRVGQSSVKVQYSAVVGFLSTLGKQSRLCLGLPG